MSEFEDILNRDQDKTAQKEAEQKWARFQRERELEDLSWLLSDERGRRFIWRVFNLSDVFSVTFSGDALQDARNSGMRIIGALIQKDVIEVAGFKILDQMQKEDNLLKEKEKEFK
jgi:hypothetical protein